jgi:hypothetical protein
LRKTDGQLAPRSALYRLGGEGPELGDTMSAGLPSSIGASDSLVDGQDELIREFLDRGAPEPGESLDRLGRAS